MPSLFSKKKQTKNLGLDIGSYNLKLAEIEKKDTGLQVLGLGMKDIRGVVDMTRAIKELCDETKISSKEVSISLSGEDVVARHLSLPKMNDEELKKAISFELEDHIPFKTNDIYFDFHILGDEPNAKNRMRVFLVATKKELLDSRIEVVRKAGLEPHIVTMDALAIKNTLYFNYPDKEKTNITLLNIGDKITNLLITREQVPYFLRDTHFGGDAITALLQTKLELDKAAAEQLKHSLKDSGTDTSQIIKTALANLLNEIFISLDFYENLTEQTIDEIYVSGGSSQLWGLKEFLSGYLNLDILNLDPFKNISAPDNISKEELTRLAPYFAVAIGLALEDS